MLDKCKQRDGRVVKIKIRQAQNKSLEINPHKQSQHMREGNLPYSVYEVKCQSHPKHPPRSTQKYVWPNISATHSPRADIKLTIPIIKNNVEIYSFS